MRHKSDGGFGKRRAGFPLRAAATEDGPALESRTPQGAGRAHRQKRTDQENPGRGGSSLQGCPAGSLLLRPAAERNGQERRCHSRFSGDAKCSGHGAWNSLERRRRTGISTCPFLALSRGPGACPRCRSLRRPPGESLQAASSSRLGVPAGRTGSSRRRRLVETKRRERHGPPGKGVVDR